MDIFWYSANNWQIYFGIGYILPTIGGYILIWICAANNWEIYVNYGVFGLQIVHLLEYVMCIFFKEAYSATLHPPIVGRINPILIYRFN